MPALGFVPSAMVTVPVNPVATLLSWSSAVTTTAGVMFTPPAAALGCTLKLSCAAGPGVMLNVVLAASVKPDAVAASV